MAYNSSAYTTGQAPNRPFCQSPFKFLPDLTGVGQAYCSDAEFMSSLLTKLLQISLLTYVRLSCSPIVNIRTTELFHHLSLLESVYKVL